MNAPYEDELESFDNIEYIAHQKLRKTMHQWVDMIFSQIRYDETGKCTDNLGHGTSIGVVPIKVDGDGPSPMMRTKAISFYLQFAPQGYPLEPFPPSASKPLRYLSEEAVRALILELELDLTPGSSSHPGRNGPLQSTDWLNGVRAMHKHVRAKLEAALRV